MYKIMIDKFSVAGLHWPHEMLKKPKGMAYNLELSPQSIQLRAYSPQSVQLGALPSVYLVLHSSLLHTAPSKAHLSPEIVFK